MVEQQMEQDGGAGDLAAEGTMVTALCWVSRGFAKPILQESNPDQDERNIRAHSRLQQKLAGGEEIGDIGKAAAAMTEKLEAMAIDENEDDDDDIDDAPIFTPELARLKAKEKGQQVPSGAADEGDQVDESDDGMDDDEQDGKAVEYPEEFSDSEEEKEDYTIRKTDSLIVAATAESDHSNLEVYIYEHDKGNMYVHHEVILGAYPLCLEWIPQWQGNKANLMAVGTFLPEIEIWNLDSEGCDPLTILGSVEMSEKAKESNANTAKKYKKKNQVNLAYSDQTHTDAVMSLSLNPFQSEYLASGSADQTVRIWDLEEGVCKMTYSDAHSDKVQVVRWNRKNEQTLLTAGYDGVVNVIDVRGNTTWNRTTLAKNIYKDIESAQWHPSSEHNFIVTTESGHIIGFDDRRLAEPVFNIHGHRKACSSASFSPHIPSMLVSVGTDKVCKVWDISANPTSSGSFEPVCVSEKNMKQGDLFTVQMYADIPWVLATGGQNGQLAIWDTEEDMKVKEHFKGALPSKAKTMKKTADKGLEEADKDMVEEGDDSSGFEDCASGEEEPTQEDATPKEVKKSSKKASTKSSGKKK